MEPHVQVIQILFIGLMGWSSTRGDFHAPCYGCQLFNIVHREHPDLSVRKPENKMCSYPCQCPVEELRCNEGVNIVKDGCSCCYMCARQRGDFCNSKDICDSNKDLFCHNTTGTCQAKVKKSCVMDGSTYHDGEQFKPDCKRLCTCQNGYYGCVSLCPQEDSKPSLKNCKNPALLPVPGKCCKEWTCDKLEDFAYRDSSMALESQNLVMHNPFFSPPTMTTPKPAVITPRCHLTSTNWTPCSVTCGVGVSVRVIADIINCKAEQERRVCFLRPCGEEVSTLGRKKCTPTTRSGQRYRVEYQDCRSVKEFKMKFCTNCKKDRCCYPQKTRTKFVEFECSGGRREIMNFMWIKKCACDRECYIPNKKKRHIWDTRH
ncbi:CCN family member 2-like [Haliotis asinina]|uniref:CCN family member 2-like n=1 Tax=Haliotis asinina TaxID=109174 RepID=UPI003531E69C